ncbi:MAG: hypothetical protein AAGC70_13210 [Pseudomonadota bacterium]
MIRHSIRTIAAAGIAMSAMAGVTATAEARTVVKSSVTGIGFANSRAGATGRAIRAWVRTTRRRHGNRFANYNDARRKSLSCDYIGRSRSYRSRKSIGIDGNPNSSWTCTTSARPTARVAGRPPHGRFVTGVGYANSVFVARNRAIRAWRRSARSVGAPVTRFTFARDRSVSCADVGPRQYRRNRVLRRNGAISVIGDVDSRYTCTARGRPIRRFANLL